MPPVDTLDPNPTIRVIFKGLVIAHVKDGEPSAQVGAIFGSDRKLKCHRPKITISRFQNGAYLDEINLARRLSISENLFPDDIHLDVIGTKQAGISTYQKGNFNRHDKDNSDPDDFRWYIDLEKEIFPGANLAIDKSKIKPVFHVQNAVFSAIGPTEDAFVIRQADNTEKDLGFATDAIVANITLDQLASKAVLRVGAREILTVDASHLLQKMRFEILFDCDCAEAEDAEPAVRVAGGPLPPGDFTLIFGAIGANLPENERVDIQLPADIEEEKAFSAQVYCQGGNTANALR
jgi:hypothetical protein